MLTASVLLVIISLLITGQQFSGVDEGRTVHRVYWSEENVTVTKRVDFIENFIRVIEVDQAGELVISFKTDKPAMFIVSQGSKHSVDEKEVYGFLIDWNVKWSEHEKLLEGNTKSGGTYNLRVVPSQILIVVGPLERRGEIVLSDFSAILYRR